MPFDLASLPRDPDRLIEIILALQDRNAHLEGIVAALKRTVYGPRSEKLVADTAQLPLDLDDLIFSEASAAANDDAVGPPPARPLLTATKVGTKHRCLAEAPATL